MKQVASVSNLYLGTDRKTKLTLHSDPLLRWSNPVSGVKDGALLMWTAAGRPEVLDQPFLNRQGDWVHEYSSLSLGSLVAEDEGRPWWRPSNSGVEMKSVPRASTPGDASTRNTVMEM